MNTTHIKIRESQPVGNSINSIHINKQVRNRNEKMTNIHRYPDRDKEIVLKHIDRDKEREKK